MEKERQYQFTKIEICRNCGGTGKVEEEEEKKMGLMGRMGLRLPRPAGTPSGRGTCPVCDGSGRVSKTTEITITVRPFGR